MRNRTTVYASSWSKNKQRLFRRLWKLSSVLSKILEGFLIIGVRIRYFCLRQRIKWCFRGQILRKWWSRECKKGKPSMFSIKEASIIPILLKLQIQSTDKNLNHLVVVELLSWHHQVLLYAKGLRLELVVNPQHIRILRVVFHQRSLKQLLVMSKLTQVRKLLNHLKEILNLGKKMMMTISMIHWI